MLRHRMTCWQTDASPCSGTFVELLAWKKLSFLTVSVNVHYSLKRKKSNRCGFPGLSPRDDLVMSNLTVKMKVFAPQRMRNYVVINVKTMKLSFSKLSSIQSMYDLMKAFPQTQLRTRVASEKRRKLFLQNTVGNTCQMPLVMVVCL